MLAKLRWALHFLFGTPAPRLSAPTETLYSLKQLPCYVCDAFQTFTADIEQKAEKLLSSKALDVDGKQIRFDYTIFGKRPENGFKLFIGLHNVDAKTKLKMENVRKKYHSAHSPPSDSILLTLEAPENNNEVWIQNNIILSVKELIGAFIVTKRVDPNRIYIFGTGEGACGAQVIATALPELFAAVALLNGVLEDNAASNIAHIPLRVYLNPNSRLYSRESVLRIFENGLPKKLLPKVQRDIDVIDKYDAVAMSSEALKWLSSIERKPWPTLIRHFVDPDIEHECLYCLKVDKSTYGQKPRIQLSKKGNTFYIWLIDIERAYLFLRETDIDFSKNVKIVCNGLNAFDGRVEKSLSILEETCKAIKDPFYAAVACLELHVKKLENRV